MTSEFDFISSLKHKYRLDRVGDDCAVLPMDGLNDLVVTADMLVQDIDFRLEWASPSTLGHKALAVSLSDIAAMGAEPVWAMVSLAVPEDVWNSDTIDRFYEGWFALASKFNVELVGGDISSTIGPLVIDSIVGGRVPHGCAVLRSGARPGDSIYVSGSLGGAAGGLRLLERGNSAALTAAPLVYRQIEPQPQLILANLLQQDKLAGSMIDVSDGFSSDLGHICNASGAGALIDANSLPIDADLDLFFSAEESLDMALNGGEDLELIFTSRKKNISPLTAAKITRVGEITANTGIIELRRGYETSILIPNGYRHF